MSQTNQPSDRTLAYYEDRAEVFAAATLGADVAALYEPFLSLVPTGGHVLDAGCGAGRDAAAFRRRGYRVSAFDAAPALARIAERVSGVPVSVLRFQDLDARPEYDGVWACASLLHLRRTEIPNALFRLATSLVPSGVLYVSFKRGEGDGERGGRYFTDYTNESLNSVLSQCALLELVRVWETVDVRPGRDDVWVNALAQKRFCWGASE
jgi:SAM-dependent methyltransferase